MSYFNSDMENEIIINNNSNGNYDIISDYSEVFNIEILELRNKIIASHSTYLQLEDSVLKAECRNNLEIAITDYLSKVSSANKFYFYETYNCLAKSITENKNFDAFQAIQAFEAFEKISNNLITRPWRKEFLKISPYSSAFKHIIEKQLINYESILLLIGYEKVNKEGIEIYFLTNKQSHETLNFISLDCLTCCVELKLMRQILEELHNKNLQPTWCEIYNLRHKFTSDTNFIIQTYLNLKENFKLDLKKNYREPDYLNNINQQIAIYNNTSLGRQVLNNQTQKKVESLTDNHSIGDSYFNSKINPISSNQYHSINNYNNDFSTNVPNSSDYTQNYHNYLSKKTPTSDCFLNPSVDLLNGYQCSSTNNQTYESDLQYMKAYQLQNNANIQENKYNLQHLKCTKESKDEIKSTIDYLNSNAQKLELALKLEENVLAFKDESNKNSNSFNRKPYFLEKNNKNKNLGLVYKKLVNKEPNQNLDRVDCGSDNKWSCKHCTFFNNNTSEICTMCSRTKDKVEPELVSGGKECPVCTLVNNKSLKNCAACDSSLKNSPTYI